jgi:hypothetical protein
MTTQFVYYVRCQYPDSFHCTQLASLPVPPVQFGTTTIKIKHSLYGIGCHSNVVLPQPIGNLLVDNTVCLTPVLWRWRRWGS